MLNERKRIRASARWYRCLPAGLIAVLLLCVAPPLPAATLTLGAPTSLESDADRMISYRHQEHMWQTSDGATHLIINSGGLSPGASLTLQTSTDNGATWVQTLALPDTDVYSTSDGTLVGDDLWISYSSSLGTILFSVLHYDSASQSWSMGPIETAFSAPALRAINPAIAIDSLGAVWCGFVTRHKVSEDAAIRMVRRAANGSAWSNTGLIFGTVDNVSVERSARPVAISGGVGMIYSVHEKLFWAYRLNGWAVGQPWTEQTLFTSPPPFDTDPYASHFSVAADGNQDLHLAVADHGQVLYLRYSDAGQSWDAPRVLTRDITANYVQVSVVQDTDTVVIFSNDGKTYLRAFQSADAGASFTLTGLLVHPRVRSGSGIDYSNPRLETPGRSLYPIPVMQQYVNGSLQELLHFEVPEVVDGMNHAARRLEVE